MKKAIVVEAKDIRKMLAEKFGVPEENIIKGQYSYTVVTEKDESEGKTNENDMPLQ